MKNAALCALGILVLACGPSRKSPPTQVTANNNWRCELFFEGPWTTAFQEDAYSFDLSRQQCPAVINAFGEVRVPFAFSATSVRTDMLPFGNTWQVWDNENEPVGSGNVNVLKESAGDRAFVDGTYLGGQGVIVSNPNSPGPPTYLDTGRVRVRFANQGDVVLRTRTHVQRVLPNLLPEMLGPTVASTGYPAHFYMYHHGQLEPAAFRYTWYVDGQVTLPSSNQHTFDHTFTVDGWHSVQVRFQFATDEEIWQTLQVFSMNCGGPNQCLRAAPEPPPNDLPDARHQQTSPRMPGLRSGRQ